MHFILLSLYGQEHYNFIHYLPESGIISYQVNTVVQDDQGYIWLGTTNGLQRFDGVRFKTFRHNEKNSQSIPANTVWQVLIDKKKQLWLLLADGTVGIFDTRHFSFRQVPVKFKYAVSPNTYLKRLIIDEEGNLFYLISGSEVITYNEQANRFSYESNFFPEQAAWKVSDFVQEPGTKKYWFAIENGGVAIFNRTTGHLSDAAHNTEKESAIYVFDKTKTYDHLFFDNQARLWASEQGIHPLVDCYQPLINAFMIRQQSLVEDGHANYDVKRFIQQQDGTIWVYGSHLMARFMEGYNKFEHVFNGYHNEHSIVYEMVHALYEDREENIWVCTDNNGLYRFNPSMEFFTNIDHTNRSTGKKGDGNVLSFLQTKSGQVLAGTLNDGLYRYDSDFNPVRLNIQGLNEDAGPAIWNMCASKDSNTLWLGSEGGFYKVDQRQQRATFIHPQVLANNTVRQITEDSSGNIWLGTQNKGLFTGSNGNPQQLRQVTTIPPVQINKITLDTRNRLWVGTPENGLYVINTATGEIGMHFGDLEANERKLPERGISSVLQYNDSILLIATATRLVKYNMLTDHLTAIGGPNYITGFITAVEKDKKGYVWLTSTSGLYQIDLHKTIFIQYDRTDGLDNEHFIQSASYALPNGRLLFGATNNFVSFLPGIKGKPPVANVSITDIKLQNRRLDLDSLNALGVITLQYNENPLAIEFSPFLFSSISLVKYKIDGLDKDWNMADRTYQAQYSYLPPGDYSFVIKPYDYMGNEMQVRVMLKINVKNPYWKTWWFYSGLVLLVVAALYWLDRQRMMRKDALMKMRSEIADDLHQEVNTALGNINILSEVARLKADAEPEKSLEFIEQIHAKSQNMIIAMDDMLWSISPENDSMAKTVLRLNEFIEALKIQYNVQIDLLVDKNVKLLRLTMKQRKDIFWFFKSGIFNVVRTGGTNCRIHITYDKPDLLYSLEFDTRDSNTEQLNNLRQRKELKDKLMAVHAKLDVHEFKTKTSFVVTIPVTNS